MVVTKCEKQIKGILCDCLMCGAERIKRYRDWQEWRESLIPKINPADEKKYGPMTHGQLEGLTPDEQANYANYVLAKWELNYLALSNRAWEKDRKEATINDADLTVESRGIK